MKNSTNGAAAKTAQTSARQPITWTSVSTKARGALTSAQQTLTIFGLSAVAVAGLTYARPDVARQVSQLFNAEQQQPVAAAIPAPADLTVTQAPVAMASQPARASAAQKTAPGSSAQQQHVTTWLSKRYRVATDATNSLVSTAYSTARDIKLDPLLILAVMAIESGLNPFAESPVGAQGLMQVMTKVHHAKFKKLGVSTAFHPGANIRVGAQILKEYVSRGGSVEAGLKTYVGAGAFDSDAGYGSKVMAEWRRLKQVATGQNVPTTTRAASPMVAKAAAKSEAKHEQPKIDVAPADVAAVDPIAGL